MDYPIVEIFASKQGEGFFTGRDCVFIRLGGCNKNCEWCDTDWKQFQYMSDSAIVQQVLECATSSFSDPPYVVITGGEPSIHDVRPLLEKLRHTMHDSQSMLYGVQVGVESNGTGDFCFYGQFDYVAISPKVDWFGSPYQDRLVHPMTVPLIHECRVVCTDNIDVPHLQAIPSLWRRYLSPRAIESDEQTSGWSFDMDTLYRLYHGVRCDGWNISFQTHKLAGIR